MKAKRIILFFLLLSALIPLAYAADYGEDEDYLGQVVDDYETDDNVSSVYNVIHNETLDCMELNYSGGFPVYEDFSLWIEDDPLNRLSQTATRSTWTGVKRGDVETALYHDMGIGGIGLSFEYYFIVNVIDVEAGDADERYLIAAMYASNTPGADEPMAANRFVVHLTQDQANDDVYSIYLFIKNPALNVWDESVVLTCGISYYCNLTRSNDGKTLDLTIKTGSHSGVLIDVITAFHNSFTDVFRYLKVPHKEDHPTDVNDWSSGYVEMLSISAPSSGYENGHYYTTEMLANDTGLVFMYNVTIPENTGGTVEFSNDNSTWVDHDNSPGSDTLIAGFESLDLRDLNTTSIYARFNFTTDGIFTPRMYQIRIVTITNVTCENGNGETVYVDSLFPGLAIGIALIIIMGIGAWKQRR